MALENGSICVQKLVKNGFKNGFKNGSYNKCDIVVQNN